MAVVRKPRSNGAPKNNDKSVDGYRAGRCLLARSPPLPLVFTSLRRDILGAPDRINHSVREDAGGGGGEGRVIHLRRRSSVTIGVKNREAQSPGGSGAFSGRRKREIHRRFHRRRFRRYFLITIGENVGEGSGMGKES